jgi:AraC-like DNA-binding protein
MGITNLIGLVTIVLLFIFSMFTFRAGRKSKLSNIFLTFFLLANLFYLLDYLLPDLDRIFNINTESFKGFGSTFCFLFGPTLYLFTKTITNRAYKFQNNNLSHFALFICVLLLVLSVNINSRFIYFIFNIQVVLYLTISIQVIMKYRQRIKTYFSSIDNINLTWLIYVVGAFLLMWSIDFINYYLSFFNLNTLILSNILTFISIFINFVFVILIFYKALQEPQFLSDFIDETKIKYQGSNLTKDDKQHFLSSIENHFNKELAYLNSSLTILDVANAIGISTKNISQVLNEMLNKNFYDFTNSYRINLAKEKLVSTDDRGLTVLEILYDSGFNSKSAFNAAFKKYTGMTPTEFRRRQQAT